MPRPAAHFFCIVAGVVAILAIGCRAQASGIHLVSEAPVSGFWVRADANGTRGERAKLTIFAAEFDAAQSRVDLLGFLEDRDSILRSAQGWGAAVMADAVWDLQGLEASVSMRRSDANLSWAPVALHTTHSSGSLLWFKLRFDPGWTAPPARASIELRARADQPERTFEGWLEMPQIGIALNAPAAWARPALAICLQPFAARRLEPWTVPTNETIPAAGLLDWVIYHIALGVERIYLFDRGVQAIGALTEEARTRARLLKDHIAIGRVVQIPAWPFADVMTCGLDDESAVAFAQHFPAIYDQAILYEACLMRARVDGVDWAFMIDVDEFLVIDPGATLAGTIRGLDGRESRVVQVGIEVFNLLPGGGEPFPPHSTRVTERHVRRCAAPNHKLSAGGDRQRWGKARLTLVRPPAPTRAQK